MKPLFLLLALALGGALSPRSRAEESVPELKPKRVEPKRAERTTEPPLLKPKRREEVTAPAPPSRTPAAAPNRRPHPRSTPVPAPPPHSEAPSDTETTSISLNLFTPLIKENVFDARFTTLGLEILGSFPLIRLGDSFPLFLEFGPGATYSRLSLNQPAVTFSHLFFLVPVRLRAQWRIGGSEVRLEGLGGIQFKPFEYDSRDTTDGGFHSTGDFFGSIEPEVAIGLVLPLGERLRLRGYAGYLKLAIGLESAL